MNKQLEIRVGRGAGYNIEVRNDKNGKKSISGYSIRFGQPSEDMGFIEYVDSHALDRTLADKNNSVLLLREHNAELLLGRRDVNLDLSIDSNGLFFRCELNGDSSVAATAYSDIRAKLLTQCSFGFYAQKDKWSEMSNGKVRRDLLDIDLFESSLVASPAYGSTSVDVERVRAMLKRKSTVQHDLREIAYRMKVLQALD